MYHLNNRFSLTSATGNIVSILNTFNDVVTVLESGWNFCFCLKYI